MKISHLKRNKRRIASLIFLLTLSANGYAKKVVLNPVDGVSLHEIMTQLTSYRLCMDEAQKTASRGKSAYKKAQRQQCHDVFVDLAQLMDKHSLKSIDHVSWLRWHKRDAGVGFSVDRILKNPSALVSGVKK